MNRIVCLGCYLLPVISLVFGGGNEGWQHGKFEQPKVVAAESSLGGLLRQKSQLGAISAPSHVPATSGITLALAGQSGVGLAVLGATRAYDQAEPSSLLRQSEDEAPKFQTAEITENGVTSLVITAYLGEANEVTIPAVINGLQVTAIGPRAFAGNTTLTGVNIPEGVVQIGEYAFATCGALQTVELPKSLTAIMAGAFSGCAYLYRADIPNAVVSIGDYAFSGSGVCRITFSDNLSSLGEYAFANCENLYEVVLSDSLTSISTGTFSGCTGLSRVLLGNAVTEIGAEAFMDCRYMDSMVFGASVSSIGARAFSGSYLRRVYFLGAPPELGESAFTASTQGYYYADMPGWEGLATLVDIVLEQLPRFDLESFDYEIVDGEVTITDYFGDSLVVNVPPAIEGLPVTAIGDGAFDDGYRLQVVTLPASLQRIGEYAFAYCNELANCQLPESVAFIGESAFESCDYLGIRSLPAHLTYVGDWAFASLSRLEHVFIPKTLVYIGDGAFADCERLASFAVDPENEFYANSADGVLFNKDMTTLVAFPAGNNADYYRVPDGVVHIGPRAFYYCDLARVSLPDSLTHIDNEAFSNCWYLTTIDFGNGLLSIGTTAFECCDELQQVSLPDSLRHIGSYAFCESGLEDISIPDSVRHLGFGAFRWCEDLETVILGSGITRIEPEVFRGCENLSSIRIPANVTYVNMDAFFYCESMAYIDIEGQVQLAWEPYLDEEEDYEEEYDDEGGFPPMLLCRAAPPTTNSPSLPFATTIYYWEGTPGWQGIDEVGGIPVLMLPEGADIPGSSAKVANDNFADALVLAGEFVLVTADSRGCSVEPGEPWLGSATMWWRWTAPRSADVQFDTIGSSHDTILGVFTGEQLSDLTQIAFNDDAVGLQSRVSFYAEAGTEYHVAVGSYGCGGPTVLTLYYEDFGGDFFATCENGKASIVRYLGSDPVVAVPAEYNNCSVVAIGVHAFAGNGTLEAISLPGSVTSLDANAFANCEKLTAIELPVGLVSIGENCFAYSGLESITIPESITHIGDGAFMGCDRLTSVDLPEGLVSIGDECFSRSGLVSIAIPDSVTHIGEGVFRYCHNLTTVALPEGLVSIGEDCFAGSGLTSIAIPGGVTHIGDGAFSSCYELRSVNLPVGLVSIGDYCFAGSGLQSITIPDSVTHMGSRAFEWCDSLTSATLGAGLSRLEMGTFAGCYNLETIRIPDNIGYIAGGVFAGCERLQTLVLEGPVTIEQWAFVDFNEGIGFDFDDYFEWYGRPPAIYCLAGPPVLERFSLVPGTVVYHFAGAAGWLGMDSLAGYGVITLAEGTPIPLSHPIAANDDFANATVIMGEYGWYSGNNLGGTREDGEPEHGENTLWWRWVAPADGTVLFTPSYSEPFVGLYIGNSITDLTPVLRLDETDNAFIVEANCEYHIVVARQEDHESDYFSFNWYYRDSPPEFLYEVYGNEVVITRYLGERGDDDAPIDVVVPAVLGGHAVTTIGARAFADIGGIGSVSIPEGIRHLADYAFDYCYDLRSVELPNGLLSIGTRCFFDTRLESVVIPDSVTAIGYAAFESNSYLRQVQLGTGLTTIEGKTFLDCWSLESVFIAANNSFIAQTAFVGCESLKSVTIAGDVTVASYAFSPSEEGYFDEDDIERGALHVYCLAGPPTITDHSFPPGTVIHYWAGTPGWAGKEYLAGYSLQSIDSTTFPVVFITGDRGVPTGGGAMRQEVSYGQAAVAPTVSAAEHWIFAGWDRDFSQVTAPMLVFARFEGVKYPVTFDLGGKGSRIGGGELQQQVEYGRAATAPDVSANDGWRFMGWDKDFSAITGALNVKAQYEAAHRVTFVTGDIAWRLDGGEMEQLVKEGLAADEPIVAVADGWAFNGWDTAFDHVTGPLTVRVLYSYSQSLQAGWNLISAKLNLAEESRDLLASMGAMTLPPGSKAYVLSGNLAASQACWVYCQTAEDITLVGTAADYAEFTAILQEGWNFAGPLTTCYVADIGPGAVVWAWNGQRYVKSETMSAGTGYWLYWPGDQGQTAQNTYLIIDLQGGVDTENYPVAYRSTPPAYGWTDVYKTTKLVLRKIPAGTFVMGSPADELGRWDDETQHQVTLTKDFYVGVFEVTQKQWERVMGSWPSTFYNASYRDARPVETVSYDDIRGSGAGAGWPANNAVDADSFLGRLRAKTGLALDLPTEAQWEYACRAGTTTALNSGKNLTDTWECPNMAEVGRYWYNGGGGSSWDGDTSGGTAKVGSYLPNQWGLYDMHGNVWEWSLDWYQSEQGSSAQTDPRGAAGGSFRVIRGGSWACDALYCRSEARGRSWPSYRLDYLGFRLVRAFQ